MLDYFSKKKKEDKCQANKSFDKVMGLQKEVTEYNTIYKGKNEGCAVIPNYYIIKYNIPQKRPTQMCNQFYFECHDFVRKNMQLIAQDNFKASRAWDYIYMTPSYLAKLDDFQKLDNKSFYVNCCVEGMKTSLYQNFLNFKQKLKLQTMSEPEKFEAIYLKELTAFKGKLKGKLAKK